MFLTLTVSINPTPILHNTMNFQKISQNNLSTTTVDPEEIVRRQKLEKRAKKKRKLDSPAFYIGTDYEGERLDGTVIVIPKLETVKQLAEARTKLSPSQLKGLVELQTTRRPRLDMHGTKDADGNRLVFLVGLDSPKGEPCWYAKHEDETLVPVEDCEHLYESDTTYNENDERQRNAKERNAQAISAAARRLVSSFTEILRKDFWIGRATSVDDHLVFVCLNNEGVLTLMDINYTKGAANKLRDTDVYTLLETWANQVGLSYDVYKQKIVTKDGTLDEITRNALHLQLGRSYCFQVPAAPVKAALPQLANKTPINSLTEEMRDLEQQVMRGDLELVDHRTVATGFLKVEGTDDEKELYDAMMATWIEGMVMRALYPGANFRYCLILTGPQQCGKTAFFSILATKEHMTPLQNLNSSETSHTSISHSDIQRRLSTNNVAVINEIGSVFRRIDSELFKDFLDSTTVEFTPKYMNESIRQFRTAVFCGTNNSDEILVDETGSTRFWFIPAGVTRQDQLDFTKLTESRNGIVASALMAVLEKVAEDPSVVDSLGLSKEHQDLSERLNSDRAKFNAFTELVETAACLPTKITDNSIDTPMKQFITLKELEHDGQLTRDQLSNRHVMSDIRSALATLGYEPIGRKQCPKTDKTSPGKHHVYSLNKEPWDRDKFIAEREGKGDF